MVERRLTGMIAAAAVLIVLFIFWDAFRPPSRPMTTEADGPERIAEPQLPPAAPPPQPEPVTAPTTTSQGNAVPVGPDGREPSYIRREQSAAARTVPLAHDDHVRPSLARGSRDIVETGDQVDDDDSGIVTEVLANEGSSNGDRVADEDPDRDRRRAIRDRRRGHRG